MLFVFAFTEEIVRALSSLWNASQQKLKGFGTVWEPVHRQGTSSTAQAIGQHCQCGACSFQICLWPAHQMGIAGTALSVRGITCEGRWYLICAKIAALSHKSLSILVS